MILILTAPLVINDKKYLIFPPNLKQSGFRSFLSLITYLGNSPVSNVISITAQNGDCITYSSSVDLVIDSSFNAFFAPSIAPTAAD